MKPLDFGLVTSMRYFSDDSEDLLLLGSLRPVRVDHTKFFSSGNKTHIIIIGTLHCLLVAICLADRQQETATYCTHTVVVFELALWLCAKEVWINGMMFFLIASPWAVATQFTASLTFFWAFKCRMIGAPQRVLVLISVQERNVASSSFEVWLV